MSENAARNYEDDIYFTASLLEFTARTTHNRIADVAKAVGVEGIALIDRFASVSHCLSFEENRDELVERYHITEGTFDPLSTKPEGIEEPSFLSIGRSYSNLVMDVEKEPENYPQALYDILCSPISQEMSNYRSAFFCSPRDYLLYAYQTLGATKTA